MNLELAKRIAQQTADAVEEARFQGRLEGQLAFIEGYPEWQIKRGAINPETEKPLTFAERLAFHLGWLHQFRAETLREQLCPFPK